LFVRYAPNSDHSTAEFVCPLSADIVAKRFFVSRRATLIQEIDLARKIDSIDAPV